MFSFYNHQLPVICVTYLDLSTANCVQLLNSALFCCNYQFTLWLIDSIYTVSGVWPEGSCFLSFSRQETLTTMNNCEFKQHLEAIEGRLCFTSNQLHSWCCLHRCKHCILWALQIKPCTLHFNGYLVLNKCWLKLASRKERNVGWDLCDKNLWIFCTVTWSLVFEIWISVILCCF